MLTIDIFDYSLPWMAKEAEFLWHHFVIGGLDVLTVKHKNSSLVEHFPVQE